MGPQQLAQAKWRSASLTGKGNKIKLKYFVSFSGSETSTMYYIY